MSDNKYYEMWKRQKPLLSLVPAIIFWFVSMVFFVFGLSFKNPIVLLGADLTTFIAISLSVSNTIIQVIGNDQEAEGLGVALMLGWMASYALGIGTNVVGLLSVLSIADSRLEWVIAIGLGTMIEVLPERLLVQFLKTYVTATRKPKQEQKHFKPIQQVPNSIPRAQKPAPKPSMYPTMKYRPINLPPEKR